MSDTPAAPLNATDFSLTACGPVDRLQERLGIAGAEPPRLVLRALVLALFAWVPMAVIEIFAQHQTAPQVAFFQDIAAYVRFLIVIPVLIFAEGTVGRRTRMVATGFAKTGLIGEEESSRYQMIVRRTRKLADSFLVEVAILVLAWAAIAVIMRGLSQDGIVYWYEGAADRLSVSGYWYAYVASPIVLFLFLRWAWRFVVWAWFLRRVSKLDLRVVGTHPDHAGGLGFVTVGHDAFAMCTFAASAVLAGAAANRILYEGVHLTDYQSAVVGFIVMAVVIGILPLFVFLKILVRAKRIGLIKYGEFASKYVNSFERKWIDKKNVSDEMLGSGDIQSLADLGGSFERLDTMRSVPFDRRTVIAFAIAAASPILPLFLTVMPLREMVHLLFKAMI
jgi:hypothetical protein